MDSVIVLANKHGISEKVDTFALSMDKEYAERWLKVLKELDTLEFPNFPPPTLDTVVAEKFVNAAGLKAKVRSEIHDGYDFAEIKKLLASLSKECGHLKSVERRDVPPLNTPNALHAHVIDVDWENTPGGAQICLYTRDVDSAYTSLVKVNFHDYFYVRVTSSATIANIKKAVGGYEWYLREKKYTEAHTVPGADSRKHCTMLCGLEKLVLRFELVTDCKSVYGYQPYEQTFLKVFTVSPTVSRDLFRGLSKKHQDWEWYEAETDYVNKFMTKRAISACIPIAVYDAEVERGDSCNDRLIHVVDETTVRPIDGPTYVPRMMYYDIECLSLDPDTFPSAECCPVIQISYLLSTGFDELRRGVLCLHDTPGDQNESFEFEEQLLIRFAQIIREFNPDAITGFNSNNFDMPYILDRMRVLGITFASELSRRSGLMCTYKRTFKQSKQYGTKEVVEYSTPGRLMFDFFEVIKADVTKRLRSYSLKSICSEYLGDDNKEDLRYRDIPILFQSPEGRSKIASYCMKDTVLLINLDKTLMLGVNAWAMARVLGTTPHVVLNSGLVFKLMCKLKQYTERFKFLIPSFTQEQKPKFEGKYQGAFVLDPVVGFHEDPVGVLDYAGLYPSLMIYYNLSYDTIVTDKTWMEENPDKWEMHNGVPFVKTDVHFGILPLLEQEMGEERKAAKKKKAASPPGSMDEAVYDGLQLANKVIMNSLYGMAGSPTATIPCVEIAATITGMGRYNLMAAKSYVEENYCKITGEPAEKSAKVVYGDTDSIFIKMPGITVAKAIEYGKELERCITRDLYNRPNALVMEYEKTYCPLLLVTAKRYVGSKYEFDPNKFKVAANGLQLVKRDAAVLCVKTMQGFFDCIFKEKDKAKAAEVVREAVRKLYADETPLDYFKLTKKISRKVEKYDVIPPHIEAWQRMVQRVGKVESPSIGEMFDFIMTRIDKKTKGLGHAMVDYQLAVEKELVTSIDKDYYFNTFILKPLKEPMEMILGKKKTDEILDQRSYTRTETVVPKPGNILHAFGLTSLTSKRKGGVITKLQTKKSKK